MEPSLGKLLGPSLTFRALELDASNAEVLMKSSAGLPLLCEKEYGKGRVLLFASTCDREWNVFAGRPGFVLWSHFLAEYLTQSPLAEQPSHRTGDLIRLPAPPGEKEGLWVRKPDRTLAVALRSNDGSGDFEFSDTLVPGVYTVLKNDRETSVGLFAVNVETYESDLSYLDDDFTDLSGEDQRSAIEAELKSRLGQPPLVRYIADVNTLADELGRSGGGLKLWDVLLVVVLFIALFEPWLANQISARLYARNVAAPSVVVPGRTDWQSVPQEVTRT